ncbi:DUF4012 domain-containing protein [Actinacidiphila oryziradicis]|uniref:DUF4012 domain-containing protein n=1 Tax=Actinacidiphila oryziradicis TaxID=2571141 RepID=A0A4U0SQU7_9ACTN|nr:DUF4012 domain-containing protein [Actinacidiphila oryziradicis]TKA11613.1 DUF4012 domain-containing protein [Actinacidiphila oryziradicis]
MPPRERFHDQAGSGFRARRRLSRRARPLLWGAVGLVLAGAAWIVLTGVLARNELLATQRSLATLQNLKATRAPTAGAQGLGSLAPEVRSAAAHAARAHRYTTGPAWYLAAQVPVLGDPVRTVRGAAWATNRVTADVLPPLVRLAADLTADARAAGSPIDLAALRRAAPSLERAAHVASDTRTRSAGLPPHTWLPTADEARTRLKGQLDRLAPATADAATAARVLPAMMGAEGERRYLVIFQNTAEARGTGGLPGAFAVLTASQGKLSFGDFGNDTLMANAHATVDFGKEYTAEYSLNAPTTTWVNANLSPHFPYAAQIWANAWSHHSGKKADGVIALDPGAMAGLLAVTGPARLADGTIVSAGNVVDLTERTSYAAFADTMERKGFFLDVASATAAKLLPAADGRRVPALLSALRTELNDGRVTMWSAHPPEQRELQRHHFAGDLPDGPAPFAGLVVNNAAGSKLDYYLDRKLDWEPQQCSRYGREITVTATLTNRAPASGLPTYVTQRVDRPPYATRPGDNRLLVSYFASTGAVFTRATLDGRTALLNSATERGHPVFTLDMELPAQSARTLKLYLVEPPATPAPVVLRQPLVRPLQSTVRPYPRCSR